MTHRNDVGLMSYRDELFRASFSDDGDDNDGNDDASGKQTNGIVTPAGSRKPDARSAQNDNPDYQAVDGWWFRRVAQNQNPAGTFVT